MAKGKLKGALDQYRGRNIRLEKQRKKEKEARKRKGTNRANGVEGDDSGLEDGAVQLDEEEVEVKANGKVKKAKDEKKRKGILKKAKEVVEPEWETDESEDDEDEVPELMPLDVMLEDSDDEGSSEDDNEEDEGDEDEGAEEDEEDIPLSDIESLASEDKGDIIPHQRLTINNTAALTAALNRISLPYSKLAFSEHQSITSDEPTEIPDVEDDLNRELAFYKQSLAAVNDARALLKKEGVPFSRPVDYFAEMVKSDEHMGKIKKKLVDDAAGKKAAAEARRQRDLKKFGKQVQVAKMQERAKEKKNTLEKISLLKRKRSGADLTTTKEEDLFDVELDNAAKAADRRDKSGKPVSKRQKKDDKFGFGGKKRHAKSNDASSTSDMRGFNMKKMKGTQGGGASKRLGKSRRAKRA